MERFVALRCVVLCCVVLCRVVSCRVVLCCVVLCCVVLCCVVSCRVVLCFARLNKDENVKISYVVSRTCVIFLTGKNAFSKITSSSFSRQHKCPRTWLWTFPRNKNELWHRKCAEQCANDNFVFVLVVKSKALSSSLVRIIWITCFPCTSHLLSSMNFPTIPDKHLMEKRKSLKMLTF